METADTATRKVGVERVMDAHPAPGVDFSDWFLKWLDLVGKCEQARGRMIDDDMKVAVIDAQEIFQRAQRSPCAREPTVGKCRKQVPCDARAHPALVPHTKSFFFPQKPPMEIAAVSTSAGDSDATVSALGWYGSWHEKGHGKGNNGEKGKVERNKQR